MEGAGKARKYPSPGRAAPEAPDPAHPHARVGAPGPRRAAGTPGRRLGEGGRAGNNPRTRPRRAQHPGADGNMGRMRVAHSVENVRAAERELMSRLPEGALMQRA